MPDFTCPVCGSRSTHPKDIEHGYCGNCHDFTGVRADAQQVDGRGALTQLAAECHRAKWAYDIGNDEQKISVREARSLVDQAFREFHRIGDLALKLRDASPQNVQHMADIEQAAFERGVQYGHEEMQQTFDLRWTADMRAIKRWQAAHPGNDLTWPDHADLVVWLMEQLDSRT